MTESINDKRNVKCPKCGSELPDETIEQLLKKEEKEVGFLFLGVVLGAVLGLIGSLWVGFLFDALRSLIPQAQWFASSLIGLAVTTVVSIYVLIKMLRYATGQMEGEGKGIKIEG